MGTVWAIILSTFALMPIAAPFAALQWIGEKLMDVFGVAASFIVGFFQGVYW